MGCVIKEKGTFNISMTQKSRMKLVLQLLMMVLVEKNLKL